MARNPKPLRLLVSETLSSVEAFHELAEKGHTVEWTGELEEYDLVFSPRAWRMFPELASLVEAAVKGARAVKYPAKKKES